MEQWLGFPEVKEYRGINLSDAPFNKAFVIVNTTVENIRIYSKKSSCLDCNYVLEAAPQPHEEVSWRVDTGVDYFWRIVNNQYGDTLNMDEKKGWLCQMRQVFQEYGVYRLDVGRCSVKPEVQPVNSYMPLLLANLIVFALLLLYMGSKYFYKLKRRESKQEKVLQIVADSENHETRALHAFRDILMSMLIFLTTGGGAYSILTSKFGGLSLADCIFFAFVWTIGFNIPFVMEKAFFRQSKCAMFLDICKKSIALIFLGVSIDAAIVKPEHLQDISVKYPLEMMGISYFVVASAYSLTVQKFEMIVKKTICKAMGNLVSLLWCWIIAGFLLAIITILISTLSSFNCLGNTRLVQRGDYPSSVTEVTLNCNNYSSELANLILVAKWERIIDPNNYLGFSSGVMGLMTTIMSTMVGLKAGLVYVKFKSHSDRFKLWVFWATIFAIGGLIFSAASYPLNFNLWPISTFLFITSTSLCLYGIIYILLECCETSRSLLSSGSPISATLPVFCGHLIFSYSIPFYWTNNFESHIMCLAQNYWIVFLWIVIGKILQSKVRIHI